MASDLKIEIFACDLFYRTWINKNIKIPVPNILQAYGEECCKVENINEVYDIVYIFPIFCRRQLFKNIFRADFTDEKAKGLTSLSECYNYVSSKCDDLFGGLTVFERMFATFAFVLDFCTRILNYDRLDVIEKGHIFWAMYFDKFTEVFYLTGGWPRLKEVAKAYCELINFLYLFPEETNFKLKEATENYLDFKNSDHYEEHKIKQKEHVSKLWIKFRKQRFENYIIIPTTDQYFFTALEVEDLLTSLKNVLNTCLTESIPSTDRKCSEIHTDDVDNKINTNDVTGIQHLPERNCETSNANQIDENISNRDPPPCVRHEMIFCSEIERASGNEKLNLVTCLEARSSKNENDLMETDNRKEMIPTSRMSEADDNEKISTCILPTSQFIDSSIDELFSRNTKIEETPSAPEVFSTNQIHKLPHDRKLSPCRATEEMNLYSQSDSDGDVNQKTLEATNYSKNGDNQKEEPERKTMKFTNQMVKSKSNENLHILPTSQFIDACIDKLCSKNTKMEETMSAPEVLSINQITESKRDESTTSNNLPTPKVYSPANRCENTSHEIKQIDGTQEDLRKEQEDRLIKIFLRMILVLNDRHGTKLVRQGLQSIDEDSQKTDVVPNKKKKKSKKKSKKK